MTKQLVALPFLLALPLFAFADGPITGFADQFNRSTLDTIWQGEPHTLWRTSTPETYQLGIVDQTLEIGYTRTSESGANDNFSFTPPREIDVSEYPRIFVSIKSDIDTELTLRNRYSPISAVDHELEIPGDDSWHTYAIHLDESMASSQTLEQIFFYFDRGSSADAEGTIRFDNFRVAGFGVHLSGLQAETIDPTSIRIQWEVDDPDGVASYNVYRHTEREFEITPERLIGFTETTEYLDDGLVTGTFYHYKVAPVDTLGNEHINDLEVRQPAYDATITPGVSVQGTFPQDNVKRYETIMIGANIQNAVYDNPYDPDEIDLRARFYSPSGDTIPIFGFYNGSPDWQTWMVRFAPMETGTWEYKLMVSDISGSGETSTHSFTVVDSDHHGMLTVSPNNPNYLMHHDSTSFYGMGPYYPWSVTEDGLDRLVNYDANIFGYWNSTYDGGGNNGGRYMLESMDSGVGYIDERKAARIDEVLEWAEERELYVMFAIWPHDWLRIRGQPWNVEHSRWYDENPYSLYYTPEEFYTSDEAWEQQKKQYRYIIARWGHHRSMGIWEVINEIHGTTGFVRDEAGAVEWTNKMHRFFREHDPYNRPTTASYGSINIYNQRAIEPEMVNRHYYEAQGGYSRPYNDNERDGLYNVTNVYREMKAIGERPATLGEAGYHTMFSDTPSDEYTREFHNAFWSGIAMGMATTPFWWDYTSTQIITNERMETFRNVSKYVSDLNFAHTPFSPSEISSESTKAFGMTADTVGIGWMWTHGDHLSGRKARQSGLEDGSFATKWYNTWTGNVIRVDTSASVDAAHALITPELEGPRRRDIAFKTRRIDDGLDATRLNLFFRIAELAEADGPVDLLCYIGDPEGRLVPGGENGYEVTFHLSGPGSLSTTQATTENGYAVITYQPDPDDDSEVVITAEADGLEPAELSWKIPTSVEPEDDGDQRPQQVTLLGNYPNPFNPSTVIRYAIPDDAHVSLVVYDALGRIVQTLVDTRQPAGAHAAQFDASALSSGIYLYRLQVGNEQKTGRMTLVK